MYWLPPSRVKQSGNATTTGGMRCSPINRSSRSGRFSRKPTQFVCDRPLLVNPTRSTSSGKPCPSWPAGRYTSTTRTDGSPSMLLLRAGLSTLSRLTEPIGPKNLRMHPPPAAARAKETFLLEHYGRPEESTHLLTSIWAEDATNTQSPGFGSIKFLAANIKSECPFQIFICPAVVSRGVTEGRRKAATMETPATFPRPVFRLSRLG